MRVSVFFGLCSVLAMATPALAQNAAPAQVASAAPLVLSQNMLIVSSDGHQVGRIDSLVGTKASPSGVSVIKDDHFVTIPVDTLSAGDHGRIVTTMKYHDIR